jgi:hypothetical protein
VVVVNLLLPAEASRHFRTLGKGVPFECALEQRFFAFKLRVLETPLYVQIVPPLESYISPDERRQLSKRSYHPIIR